MKNIEWKRGIVFHSFPNAIYRNYCPVCPLIDWHVTTWHISTSNVTTWVPFKNKEIGISFFLNIFHVLTVNIKKKRTKRRLTVRYQKCFVHTTLMWQCVDEWLMTFSTLGVNSDNRMTSTIIAKTPVIGPLLLSIDPLFWTKPFYLLLIRWPR